VVPGSTTIPHACPLTVALKWIFPIFQTIKGAVSAGVSDAGLLVLPIFHSFRTKERQFALVAR
jgi:hypothetical protein